MLLEGLIHLFCQTSMHRGEFLLTPYFFFDLFPLFAIAADEGSEPG